MKIISSLLAVYLSVGAVAANAAIIDFQFGGTITYGGTLASVGDKIVGSFSYDSSVSYTDEDGVSPPTSYYSFNAPFGISATIGSHLIATSGLNIRVTDNFGGNVQDGFDLSAYSPLVDGHELFGNFGFTLNSRYDNPNVLNSSALPSFLDVSAFNAGPTLNYGWLQRYDIQEGAMLRFTIDSIAPSVPIPSAAGLFGSGLLGLTGFARRRKGA